MLDDDLASLKVRLVASIVVPKLASTTRWRHSKVSPSVTLALSGRSPPVTGGSPHVEPVMQKFDCFFVVNQNNLSNKQSICRLSETQWRSYDIIVMWRHWNDVTYEYCKYCPGSQCHTCSRSLYTGHSHSSGCRSLEKKKKKKHN